MGKIYMYNKPVPLTLSAIQNATVSTARRTQSQSGGGALLYATLGNAKGKNITIKYTGQGNNPIIFWGANTAGTGVNVIGITPTSTSYDGTVYTAVLTCTYNYLYITSSNTPSSYYANAVSTYMTEKSYKPDAWGEADINTWKTNSALTPYWDDRESCYVGSSALYLDNASYRTYHARVWQCSPSTTYTITVPGDKTGNGYTSTDGQAKWRIKTSATATPTNGNTLTQPTYTPTYDAAKDVTYMTFTTAANAMFIYFGYINLQYITNIPNLNPQLYQGSSYGTGWSSTSIHKRTSGAWD